MVIDTSVLMAVLLKKPDAAAYRSVIKTDQTRLISTATVLEAHMVAMARIGSQGSVELDSLLQTIEAEIVPFTGTHANCKGSLRQVRPRPPPGRPQLCRLLLLRARRRHRRTSAVQGG